MIDETVGELILEFWDDLDVMEISKRTGLSCEEVEILLEIVKEEVEKTLFSELRTDNRF